MRKKLTIVFLLCTTLLGAQDKYNAVLEKTSQLSPYEAIYLLMDYQQDHPQQASVYFHLGNLCYDILPSRDPLHHYRELNELLYRSKLFYGNCLHFAQDQKLPGWQYAVIANGEKKIEYDALKTYLQPRIDEVARRQKACDSIHNSFYRLVEQYNRCQHLFSQFLSQYAREKTAHLHLTDSQREDLERLAEEAEKIPSLIEAYQQALTLEPIRDYNPSFHWLPIELYRLDGLTTTDFMQNNIRLWDYYHWVEHFLREQNEQYERLYADVETEYEHLSLELKRYTIGAKVNGKVDESIVGRCARLELETPHAQALSSLQALTQLGHIEQQIGDSKKLNSVRELIPLLQLVRDGEKQEKKITAPSLRPTGDSAMALIRTHIAGLAQPLSLTQQATHTSAINGEVMQYNALEGEHVFSLLNMTDGWRCVVVEDGTNEVKVLDLNYMLIQRGTALRLQGETPFVITAMPDGGWALVTDKNISWGK